MSEETQSLTADEVGDAGTVLEPTTNNAPAAEEVVTETPLELARRMAVTVENTKAWALAKADSIEKRITDVGGEVGAELKEALAKLRAVSASTEPVEPAAQE